MSTKPESVLHRKIKDALKKEFPKSWWMKVHGGPYQAAGIPDLLGCVSGLFIALEVKMPGTGKLSNIQKIQISLIKKSGGYAVVVESVEGAIHAVRYAVGLSKGRS